MMSFHCCILPQVVFEDGHALIPPTAQEPAAVPAILSQWIQLLQQTPAQISLRLQALTQARTSEWCLAMSKHTASEYLNVITEQLWGNSSALAAGCIRADDMHGVIDSHLLQQATHLQCSPYPRATCGPSHKMAAWVK